MGLDQMLVREHDEKTVVTWRKANQIHAWFVQRFDLPPDFNLGHDPPEVNKNHLQELHDLCKQVLETIRYADDDRTTPVSVIEEGGIRTQYRSNHRILNSDEIHELLPSQPGFFFGSTEYDQSYVYDVINTVEALEPLLGEDAPNEYRYVVWW
jgi:hypothetical protein